MIGNLFQMLYTAVDTMVVGKYVSKTALTAVGAAAPVVELLLGLVIGLSNGLSVVIAQKVGAGGERHVKRAIANGFYLISVLSAAILRAHGNSVIPLLFLILSAVMNVAPDLVFVNVFNMGIAGVALSTIMSQLICCILCCIYMMKKRTFSNLKKRILVLASDI